MSRLKVGSIEIDGTKVTIAESQQVVPGSTNTGVIQSANVDMFEMATRIPGGFRTWLIAGGVTAGTGTLINIASKAWQDPFTAMFQGGILAPLGIGIVAIGLAKWLIRRRSALWHVSALGTNHQQYTRIVEGLLENARSGGTVDWLVTRTRWPESVVVRTLAILRERGRIQEDLDLETGKHFYVLSSTPRDLDSRLQDLTP